MPEDTLKTYKMYGTATIHSSRTLKASSLEEAKEMFLHGEGDLHLYEECDEWRPDEDTLEERE